MKGVSEGKWRWVELECWFVLYVLATRSFFLNGLFSALWILMTAAMLKVILSLVFEFPVKGI